MAAARSRSLVLIVAFVATCRTALAADCSVDVSSPSMPSPQPVLLSTAYAQDFSSYLLPNRMGILAVARGQQVTVACPGSNFYILGGSRDHVTAECVDDSLFSVDSVRYTLNGLLCSSNVAPSARYTGASCGDRGLFAVVEVGFSVGNEFHILYDVCFSNKTLSTAYAHHTIPAEISGAQETDMSKFAWTDGSFFGKVDVGAAYEKQNETIGQQLNVTEDLFAEGRLERGALVPAADLMLEAQQAAAFFGVNSAPRWTQLDQGNWGTLEQSLRRSGRRLEVFTGTLQVLALDNSAGVATGVYLSAPAGGRKALPVPKYFWKIVYEPQKQLCAAFVTVNDPSAEPEDLDTRYSLCKDICGDIDWLKWDQNNRTGGLSFCCDYEDFKRVVPGVPVLDVKGHRESSSRTAAPALWLTAALLAAVAFTGA